MNYKNLQAAGVLLFSLSFLVQPALAQKDATPMQTNFLTPPDSSKPGLYWYWLNGNISKEGVEKDLESMAKVGIGRAFIGNIGLGNEVPNGKVKMFTDDWWDVVRAAMKAGTKLGVDIGTFNSPGWSQSGGPWVKPTETMRYLGSSEVQVTGPKTISIKLATPGADFQDVAVLAFPTKKHTELAQLKPVVKTSLPVSNTANMVDGDIKTESTFSADIMQKKEVVIDITTVKPLAAQSLLVYTSQNSISANAELQVLGKTGYKTVKKFPLQRHNSALNVGFMPYAPVVVSFAKVTGSKFRLLLTDINGGNSGIAEIKLTSQPYVESYPEKQLAKMFQTPLPLWNEYQWKSQPESMEEEDYTDPSEMINITSSLSKDGTLNWKVPKGNWTVVRYGMQPTGVTNSPAPAEGTGLEVDKMNSEALVTLFDSFVGQMIKKIPADERKSFKYVVADSYETG
ncbi:MAG: glycoside hydrolase family 2, partial [Sphingobacteriales bacterium]